MGESTNVFKATVRRIIEEESEKFRATVRRRICQELGEQMAARIVAGLEASLFPSLKKTDEQLDTTTAPSNVTKH